MIKKVVHIITGLNDGGAEAVLFRLCVNSNDYQHVVISLMDKGKYGPLLENSGIKVQSLNMTSGNSNFKKFFQLVRLIRREKPDVVQTWMYHADLLGGIAAKAAGIKKVFWGIRHSTLENDKSKKLTIIIARVCALLSRFVPEKIICCANKALSVHRDIGYTERKLVVIPNGYDLTNFMINEQLGAKFRESFNIAPETFLLGKVGRYNPFKDHGNLLSALFELKLSGIDFKCLLVGSGLSNSNQELMTRINELDLTEKIVLAGQQTDIPAVMNALDLHVLSSSSEGFPNVLAEAMACGTPSISTDVGDASEIVGDRALLCAPKDPRALTRLMLAAHTEWLERPNDWIKRQLSCSEHIKSNFSIKRMVDAYEQCWFRD